MNKFIDILDCPLVFEENKGQLEEKIKFITKAKEVTTFFFYNMIEIKDKNNKISIGFNGINSEVKLKGQEKLEGKVNYFIGKDKSKWITDISTYSKIIYEDIFPGINMVCYGNGKNIEFDYIVEPGADYNNISIQVNKSNLIKKDENENLLIKSEDSLVKFIKPMCYQQYGDKRIEIKGNYKISEKDTITFDIGDYDKSMPLIIDPILICSTYLGGNETIFGEGSYSIDTDNQGNMYVTGYTSAPDFPVKNSYQDKINGQYNAFISKYNSTGNTLIYSTYLGGSGLDYGSNLIIDPLGNVYVTGNTSSKDFPILNSYQSNLKGNVNAFISKLNSTGNALLYSTYLGGTKEDYGTALELDSNGYLYVGGYTNSLDFPVKNAFQYHLKGMQNCFVTKLSQTGNIIIFSTYLGGKGIDALSALQVDNEFNVFITGNTNSLDFPTVNAFQPTLGGKRDAFITEINNSGSSLKFSSFFGGNEDEFGNDLAIDEGGNVFITGSTQSKNIPIKNPLQSSLLGVSNAFIIKVIPNSGTLSFSTYLGGTGFDYANCITLGKKDNIYITGGTTSIDFPTVNPIQESNGGATDVFITKINNDGTNMLFSTYLGGTEVDIGNCISWSDDGSLAITGVTYSQNFPTKNPVQSELKGIVDAFIVKIQDKINLSIRKSASEQEIYIGETLKYEILVTTEGSALGNVSIVDILPVNCQYISSDVSNGNLEIQGQKLIWNIGTINNGTEESAYITVKAINCGELVNKAVALIDNEQIKEAVTTTNVVSKLSTGPVILGNIPFQIYQQYIECSCITYQSVSLINNTTDKVVYVDVYLYNLKNGYKEKYRKKSVRIQPFLTEKVIFDCIPNLYKIVFDKVSEGVFIWSSIKYSIISCDEKICYNYIETNTFSHTALIDVTNC